MHVQIEMSCTVIEPDKSKLTPRFLDGGLALGHFQSTAMAVGILVTKA